MKRPTRNRYRGANPTFASYKIIEFHETPDRVKESERARESERVRGRVERKKRVCSLYGFPATGLPRFICSCQSQISTFERVPTWYSYPIASFTLFRTCALGPRRFFSAPTCATVPGHGREGMREIVNARLE